MSLGVIKKGDQIRYNASDVTGTYQNLVTGGTGTAAAFTYPARQLYIYNGTSAGIMISFDGGVTDQLFLAAGAFYLDDVSTNRQRAAEEYMWPVNTIVSVKEFSGTALAGERVYLAVFYAPNEWSY